MLEDDDGKKWQQMSRFGRIGLKRRRLFFASPTSKSGTCALHRRVRQMGQRVKAEDGRKRGGLMEEEKTRRVDSETFRDPICESYIHKSPTNSAQLKENTNSIVVTP